MPGTKEIRLKIRSVQNTRKITKAMEMVAASKMRRAQDRMRAARPYGEKIRNVAAHISHANPEYRHPFLVARDTVKRVGIIVITTDKGLCGALNTNLLRMVLSQYKQWQGEGEEIDVCCIGNKGLGFMQRLGANVISHVVQIGDRPVGLLADRVLDIVNVDPSKVQPVPRVAEVARIDFLSGLVTVDSGMIALIDLPNLLSTKAEGTDAIAA